jgi:hypothetical protein
MTKSRQGTSPGRRILPANTLSDEELRRIAQATSYSATPYHKLHPGDYGFDPPVSPRPSESPCDDKRIVLRSEAAALLAQGIRKGMISRPRPGGLPKYVWAVDENGDVYEAKTKPEQKTHYHGYRLGEDEQAMQAYVLSEWNKR